MSLHQDISFVEGPNLKFRLVQASDASFIYSLRIDPTYNGYLTKVEGGVAEQKVWIEEYKKREENLTELYYLIERARDSVPCGLVRLYEIGKESFTWGSWILNDEKPRKAALESALLIYKIGFEILTIPKAVFDVRLENMRTIAFHNRFGARLTHETALDAHFILEREQFLASKPSFISVLKGAR